MAAAACVFFEGKADSTSLCTQPGRGRFLGAISHELRTPLNGLLGSLELALQRASSEPTLPAVERRA